MMRITSKVRQLFFVFLVSCLALFSLNNIISIRYLSTKTIANDKSRADPLFAAREPLRTRRPVHEPLHTRIPVQDSVKISKNNKKLSKVRVHSGGVKKRINRRMDYYKEKYTAVDKEWSQCRGGVEVEMLKEEDVRGNVVWMLETSGRPRMTPRQACGAESAARQSGLPVILVTFAERFHLLDNVTCQLVTGTNVTIRRVDLKNVYRETPLQNLQEQLANSPHAATHYADTLRLVLVWRYGGYYSDMDAVVLRSLAAVSNVVGISSPRGQPSQKVIPNSEFQFSSRHPLLWRVMQLVAERFSGETRVEVGPLLLTQAVKEHGNLTGVNAGKVAPDLTILPSKVLFPVKCFQAWQLWPLHPTPPRQWDAMFRPSLLVHFFGHATNRWKVVRAAKYEAYSYLGPKHCPLAFGATRNF